MAATPQDNDEPRVREGPCRAEQRVTVALLMVLLIVSLTKETSVIELVSSSSRHQSVLIAVDSSQAPAVEPVNSYSSTIADSHNNITAGFIHIGKTGGSTLASVIRNSCHSFVRRRGKCRGSVDNESIASELVTAYYHVPDLHLIPKSNHDLYYVSVRDPFERFQSAFTSNHPINRQYLHKRGNGINRKQNRKAFQCFPTLEDFARHLDGRNINDNVNCTVAARAAVNGETKIMVHMWGNYQKMAGSIPKSARGVYAIRTTHLWDDWFRINKILDPARDVYIPRDRHERNVKNLTLPVTRNVSDEGRSYLCEALRTEYRVYFELLERAANLNTTDVEEAREVALLNCPDLVLSTLSSRV